MFDMMPDNSQKELIKKETLMGVGNPPYFRNSANDNAQNIKYLNLDEKIKTTYAKHTKATNKGSLYDSYIRAFRWLVMNKTWGIHFLWKCNG